MLQTLKYMNYLCLIQLSMSSVPNSQEEDDLLNHANVDTITETQEVPLPNTFSTQIVQKLQIRSCTKRRIADAVTIIIPIPVGIDKSNI